MTTLDRIFISSIVGFLAIDVLGAIALRIGGVW